MTRAEHPNEWISNMMTLILGGSGSHKHIRAQKSFSHDVLSKYVHEIIAGL